MKRICKILVLQLCLFFAIFGSQNISADVIFFNGRLSENEANTSATSQKEIKENYPVEITIELEDSSRFMGISVYKIADFKDGAFYYKPEYLAVVELNYNSITRDKIKKSHQDKLTKYIIDKNIKEDGRIDVKKGSGNIKDLEIGLYILLQNEADYNAQLEDSYMLEAPLYSNENSEYMYNIKVYPKWERTVWFSFRPEVVYPIVVVLAMIFAVLFCLFGVKMTRFASIIVPFIGGGLLGMKLGARVTTGYLWSMLFFVLIGFLCLGICLLVFGFFGRITRRSKPIKWVAGSMFLVTPIIGSVAIGFLIYKYIVPNLTYAIGISAVIGLIGIIVQAIGKKHEVVFHTYDDLLRLPKDSETLSDDAQ